MCKLSLCWANNSGPIAIIASAYALQALPWMICMLESNGQSYSQEFCLIMMTAAGGEGRCMSSFLLWAPRQFYDLSTLAHRHPFTIVCHAFREHLPGSFRESDGESNFTPFPAT